MTKVQISDHALVRWLERVHGIDMEWWRTTLAEIAQPYANMKVQHAEAGGVWLIFRGDVLVTVSPERPLSGTNLKHDRQSVNGTDGRYRDGPRHWKHKQRKGQK